mgnify:FL=1
MIPRLRATLITSATVLALSPAAFAADPVAGRKLAEEWCARCHNIEMGAPFKLQPPSFASIAVFRAENDIRGKIISPHIGMPEITWTLPVGDIDHLVAYITSLEVK